MTADTTLAACPTEREQFEAVFGAPPYAYNLSRWPDEESSALWPGQYHLLHVQTAWEAWQAAHGITGAPNGKPNDQGTQ